MKNCKQWLSKAEIFQSGSKWRRQTFPIELITISKRFMPQVSSDWPPAPAHSPVLVARLVPVDVALLQDDVLASFDQIQVVRLGAREVIQRHHHHLLLLIIVITIVVIILRGLPLQEEEEWWMCVAFDWWTSLMCVCWDCGYPLVFTLLSRNWG